MRTAGSAVWTEALPSRSVRTTDPAGDRASRKKTGGIAQRSHPQEVVRSSPSGLRPELGSKPMDHGLQPGGGFCESNGTSERVAQSLNALKSNSSIALFPSRSAQKQAAGSYAPGAGVLPV